MDDEIPAEFIQQMETMAQQMFQAVLPVMRTNVRRVLERNDKLVNQDPTALDFLTEEIVNGLVEKPTGL